MRCRFCGTMITDTKSQECGTCDEHCDDCVTNNNYKCHMCGLINHPQNGDNLIKCELCNNLYNPCFHSCVWCQNNRDLAIKVKKLFPYFNNATILKVRSDYITTIRKIMEMYI